MRRTHGWLAAAIAAMLAGVVFAAGAPEPAAAPPTSQPATSQPSAEDVMHRLMGEMKDNPLIEPDQRPAGHDDSTPSQTLRAGMDPNIIGSAPGSAPPKLRLEGEFVVSRRGRLARSSDGAHRIFIFDSDSEHTPDPPLVMTPCQMLQSMEDMTEERGDRVRFIVSGQVLLYRGVNYLLLTMWKPDEDRGNLQK